MPVDLKTNEWNSLRDQFRTLVHNEGGREDSLEQVLMMEFVAVLAS